MTWFSMDRFDTRAVPSRVFDVGIPNAVANKRARKMNEKQSMVGNE